MIEKDSYNMSHYIIQMLDVSISYEPRLFQIIHGSGPPDELHLDNPLNVLMVIFGLIVRSCSRKIQIFIHSVVRFWSTNTHLDYCVRYSTDKIYVIGHLLCQTI